jgi:hypothetical protein
LVSKEAKALLQAYAGTRRELPLPRWWTTLIFNDPEDSAWIEDMIFPKRALANLDRLELHELRSLRSDIGERLEILQGLENDNKEWCPHLLRQIAVMGDIKGNWRKLWMIQDSDDEV